MQIVNMVNSNTHYEPLNASARTEVASAVIESENICPHVVSNTKGS